MKIMFWMADTAGRCNFVSPAFLEFLGKKTDDMEGEGWLQSIHPEEREVVRLHATQPFKADKQIIGRCRMLRHDGQWIEIATRALPIVSPINNRPIGHLGIVMDVASLNEVADDEYFRSRLEKHPLHAHEELRAATDLLIRARDLVGSKSQAVVAGLDLVMTIISSEMRVLHRAVN